MCRVFERRVLSPWEPDPGNRFREQLATKAMAWRRSHGCARSEPHPSARSCVHLRLSLALPRSSGATPTGRTREGLQPRRNGREVGTRIRLVVAAVASWRFNMALSAERFLPLLPSTGEPPDTPVRDPVPAGRRHPRSWGHGVPLRGRRSGDGGGRIPPGPRTTAPCGSQARARGLPRTRHS